MNRTSSIRRAWCRSRLGSEVETVVNGRTRDIVFSADGSVLVVEDQSSLDAIPKAARAAIEKQAEGPITSVEVVTKGKTVTY